MKIMLRFSGPLVLALFSFSCGKEAKDSQIKTLTIDSAIHDPISVQSCAGEADCRAQEVRIYRQAQDQFLAFERLYRDNGYMVQDATRLLWRQGNRDVEIGSSSETGIVLCSQAYSQVCHLNIMVKHPDENAGASAEPVYLVEFSFVDERAVPENSEHAKTKLLPLIVPSPNQEDAGSCHYMAATGAMEVLWNQAKLARGEAADSSLNGSSDLSEAYLMNIPKANNDSLTGLQKILGFKNAGYRGVLNADFPYWNSVNGNKARDNWQRPLSSASSVSLPSFQIQNIHGGTSIADNSKWAVTVLNDSHIERVKAELRKDRPVVVTYNHFGYWHVVVIVGYDDSIKQDCTWTRNFIERQGSGATFANYQAQVKKAFEADGGCKGQGIFYVRDSLGWAGDGSDRAVAYNRRSYDWLKYLGNHAYSLSL